VVDEILAAHQKGAGWSQIARDLNARGVPTAHGGAKWHPSTVRAVVMGSRAA
jgi:Recombinase